MQSRRTRKEQGEAAAHALAVRAPFACRHGVHAHEGGHDAKARNSAYAEFHVDA